MYLKYTLFIDITLENLYVHCVLCVPPTNQQYFIDDVICKSYKIGNENFI